MNNKLIVMRNQGTKFSRNTNLGNIKNKRYGKIDIVLIIRHK